MNKKNFLIIGALSLVLCACDKVTPLNLNVYPLEFNPRTECAVSNSNIRLHVVANADVPIHRVALKSYDAIYLEQTILDTILTEPIKSFTMDVNYKVLSYGETTPFEINSSMTTRDGDVVKHRTSFYVLPDGQTLKSKDGITMYSALSGKFCGFDFKTLDIIPGDSVYIADSLTFFDRVPLDTTRLDVLSREWYSTSGVYFARSENFNYGEATAATISQTYKASNHYNEIRNIHNDDVILVGTNDEAFGVIKVLVVSDEEGTENDRYVFSVKSFLKIN